MQTHSCKRTHTHTHTHANVHTHRFKTCFNHVLPRDIVQSKLLLTEGMAEYARATPPSSHKGHMHCIVHYPRCVEALGPLNGCTMLSDERRNKVRVRVTSFPVVVFLEKGRVVTWDTLPACTHTNPWSRCS